jgi:hypothetical protein
MGQGQRDFTPLAPISFGIRGFGPAATASGDFDHQNGMDPAIANASSPNLAVTLAWSLSISSMKPTAKGKRQPSRNG